MKAIIRNKYIQIVVLIAGSIYIGMTAPNSWALSMFKSTTIDFTKNIDLREGDFIFQHLPGLLLKVITDVTQSPYSHCGIIVKKKDGLYVLEAIGPVKETPINQWISYGIGDRFMVVRLREEYQKDIPRIIDQAYLYKGRPYDIRYEWDDHKIYCSELVYKAVYEASEIELASLKRLGDLNWRPHEKFIRLISGGELPLDRAMITPHDLAVSDKVQVVHSTFPVLKSGEQVSLHDMTGSWQGTYSLSDIILDAQTHIRGSGQIISGALGSGLSFSPAVVDSFDPETGRFRYILKSANNVEITIEGRLDHTKEGMYGHWKDSLGFKGNFHLTKRAKPSQNRLCAANGCATDMPAFSGKNVLDVAF